LLIVQFYDKSGGLVLMFGDPISREDPLPAFPSPLASLLSNAPQPTAPLPLSLALMIFVLSIRPSVVVLA
jgi:hypothetical protein